MRLRKLMFIFVFGLAATAAAQPPLPAGWPDRLELGMSSQPGGAAEMKATTSFGFRYQYLAGGVNTGNGWATWNTNGGFATFYIQDSIDNGIVPVFTYYMIYQSLPGVNQGGESDAVRINLQNAQTMTAFFNDLKLFFQRAGAFPDKTVVLHVEPDMWGYIQQQAARQDDATAFFVQVAATGLSELAGLPNTAAGLAQGIVRLRDQYGPNVKLGFHASVWGTGHDILYADPPDAEVRNLGNRAANFYKSLGANYDVIFAEFTDRDSGLRETWGDANAWWRLADYQRNLLFLSTLSNAANKRLVLWQIPHGNTKMRACSNTDQHYQSNQVEFLLDDPSRANLQTYVSTANVVAFLFGRGDGQTTAAADAKGDGVTNPAAIAARPALTMNPNPNDIAAQLQAAGAPQMTTIGGTPALLSPWAANDDGGFFRWRAWAYYTAGAIPLNGTALDSPPASPRNLRRR